MRGVLVSPRLESSYSRSKTGFLIGEGRCPGNQRVTLSGSIFTLAIKLFDCSKHTMLSYPSSDPRSSDTQESLVVAVFRVRGNCLRELYGHSRLVSPLYCGLDRG